MSLIEQLGTRSPSYSDRALGRVVIEELKADHPDVFDDVELSDDAEARIGRLPFYKRYVLVELPVSRGRGPESVFALHIPKSDRAQDEKAPSTLWLNGDSSSIHRANEAEAIDLAEEHALDYLRFFVNFLRGDEGPFTLLDATNLIISVESDMTPTEQFELVATRERFMSGTLGDERETRVIPSQYEARFPIAYGTHFADLAKFKISNNGEVVMITSTADRGGQFRPVGAMSVLAIPAFDRISPTVLQVRQAMLPADREDPGALGRRLADANKLGEAGRRPGPGDDEAKQYYDEAIELLQDIVFDYMHLLGPDYPDTTIALTSLEGWRIVKNWDEQSGGYDEGALREARRLLATQMRSLGSFHPRTLNTRRNIALMLTRIDGQSSGSADDAVNAWDRTGHAKAITALHGLIADIREHLSEDPPGDASQRDKLKEILVDSQLSLAQTHHEMYMHHAMEDDEAAIADLKTLLASPNSALPAVTTALSAAHYWLAEYLLGAGRFDEAIAESQALHRLIAELREHLSEDPPGDSSQRDKLEEILVDSQWSLAQTHHEMYTHHAMEDDEAAIEDLKTLLASPKSALPAVTKALSDAHYWLAEYLLGAGRVDEAIVESQARLAELRAADSPDEREIDYSKQQLARFERRRDGGGNDQN